MKKTAWQLDDGKWYYLDETEDFNGPYDTEDEAQREYFKYFEWLNRPNPNIQK